MHDAGLTGNSGASLPALTASEAEFVRRSILTWADAYVDAFTTYQMPCDHNAEEDLRTTALRIAGSGISAVQGHFELEMQRTGGHRPFPLDYVNQQIWARTNSALKKGLLKVKRQRIQFTAQPDSPRTPHPGESVNEGVAKAENLGHPAQQPIRSDASRPDGLSGEPRSAMAWDRQSRSLSPKELVDTAKRRPPKRSYEKFASKIGIGKDTLYAITKETRWVSDETYKLVAEACNCKEEDLHPRDIPRPERRRG